MKQKGIIAKKKNRKKNPFVWLQVDSGPLRVARGGSGAKAPPLAARPSGLPFRI